MRAVDRLCFGTSTFAAGKLYPDKDSRPGIGALAAALSAGVRLIHSNPNLGTQWAIREAIHAAGDPTDIRHLIKVELPADATSGTTARLAETALSLTRQNLDAKSIHAVVIEIDLKRTTDRRVLVDVPAVAAFYQMAADLCGGLGIERAFGYCHSPAHLAACLRVEALAGYAAQYNQVEAWPARYLDRLAATGHPFIGMAPLRRGALVDTAADDAQQRLRPLRWVLAHPGVTCTAITMSSTGHLAEVLEAAEMPLPTADVHRHAQAWQAFAASARRSEVIIR